MLLQSAGRRGVRRSAEKKGEYEIEQAKKWIVPNKA